MTTKIKRKCNEIGKKEKKIKSIAIFSQNQNSSKKSSPSLDDKLTKQNSKTKNEIIDLTMSDDENDKPFVNQTTRPSGNEASLIVISKQNGLKTTQNMDYTAEQIHHKRSMRNHTVSKSVHNGPHFPPATHQGPSLNSVHPSQQSHPNQQHQRFQQHMHQQHRISGPSTNQHHLPPIPPYQLHSCGAPPSSINSASGQAPPHLNDRDKTLNMKPVLGRSMSADRCTDPSCVKCQQCHSDNERQSSSHMMINGNPIHHPYFLGTKQPHPHHSASAPGIAPPRINNNSPQNLINGAKSNGIVMHNQQHQIPRRNFIPHGKSSMHPGFNANHPNHVRLTNSMSANDSKVTKSNLSPLKFDPSFDKAWQYMEIRCALCNSHPEEFRTPGQYLSHFYDSHVQPQFFGRGPFPFEFKCTHCKLFFATFEDVQEHLCPIDLPNTQRFSPGNHHHQQLPANEIYGYRVNAHTNYPKQYLVDTPDHNHSITPIVEPSSKYNAYVNYGANKGLVTSNSSQYYMNNNIPNDNHQFQQLHRYPKGQIQPINHQPRNLMSNENHKGQYKPSYQSSSKIDYQMHEKMSNQNIKQQTQGILKNSRFLQKKFESTDQHSYDESENDHDIVSKEQLVKSESMLNNDLPLENVDNDAGASFEIENNSNTNDTNLCKNNSSENNNVAEDAMCPTKTHVNPFFNCHESSLNYDQNGSNHANESTLILNKGRQVIPIQSSKKGQEIVTRGEDAQNFNELIQNLQCDANNSSSAVEIQQSQQLNESLRFLAGILPYLVDIAPEQESVSRTRILRYLAFVYNAPRIVEMQQECNKAVRMMFSNVEIRRRGNKKKYQYHGLTLKKYLMSNLYSTLKASKQKMREMEIFFEDESSIPDNAKDFWNWCPMPPLPDHARIPTYAHEDFSVTDFHHKPFLPLEQTIAKSVNNVASLSIPTNSQLMEFNEVSKRQLAIQSNSDIGAQSNKLMKYNTQSDDEKLSKSDEQSFSNVKIDAFQMKQLKKSDSTTEEVQKSPLQKEDSYSSELIIETESCDSNNVKQENSNHSNYSKNKPTQITNNLSEKNNHEVMKEKIKKGK